MGMTSLQISLPQPLKAYVDAQVEVCGFETASEYIEQLVSQDKLWHSSEIEARLLASLDSGDLHLSGEELDRGALLEVLRKKLDAAG